MTINALRDNSEGEDRMMSLISYEDAEKKAEENVP